MNKKGIVIPATAFIIIAVAISVVVILAGGATIWSDFKYPVIGTSIILVALVLGFRSNFKGNSLKVALTMSLIGGLLILIPAFGILQTGFETNAIYIPSYGSMNCELYRAGITLFEVNDQINTVEITCGKNMNYYSDKCEFQIKYQQDATVSAPNVDIEICDINNNCIETSTEKLNIRPSDNIYTTFHSVELDSNRDGYIDEKDGLQKIIVRITPKRGFITKTKVDVKVLGNAYQIYDSQPNGYGTTYQQGCDLNAINDNAHIISKEFEKTNYISSKNQVPFGGRLYYVWGFTKAVTSNVIFKDGKQIYIQKPGYYMPVKVAEDGYKYADLREEEPDNTIECLPSNIYVCNSDATFREEASQDVSGQSCSLLRGAPLNEFLVTDVNEVCKFDCIDGILEKYDCETIVNCEQGYLWDQSTNTCKKVSDINVKPIDTGLCPGWWEYETTLTEVDKGFLGWRTLLGVEKETQTQVCKLYPWVTGLIIGGIVIILGIVLMLIWMPKSTKKIKKK